jgi:hypothetical protein
MKTSPPILPGASPDAVAARLDDYAARATADLDIFARRRQSVAESSFAASAEALAAPDASAPGLVSFTGGAHPRSTHFGAPRTVLATEAGVYAEFDAGLLDHPVEDPRRNDESRARDVPSIAPERVVDDPFDFTLPPSIDDEASAQTLAAVPAIGLLALGAPGLRELRRRRAGASST